MKKYFIILLLNFIVISFGNSQSQDDDVFVFVEQNPQFPGGDAARIKYIQNNLVYPKQAIELAIQGTVYVNFVVEKDSTITNPKVLRGIGGGCDEEAIRLIKAMPKWIPGKQRNMAVRCQFNMPIKFSLPK